VSTRTTFTLLSASVRGPLLATALFLAASPIGARTSADDVQARLESADFRVRVQALLLLGKAGEAGAFRALVKSLTDPSAAVRAAAAAGLATYADPAALEHLRARQEDPNPAVRKQVEAAVVALEKQQASLSAARKEARVLVKLSGVRSLDSGSSAEALGAAAQASRAALRKIPGVALLHPTEDAEQAGRDHQLPVVVLMGSLQGLLSETQGEKYVVSARVEFVVQAIPEHSIRSVLSGRASISSSAASSGNAKGKATVQEAAVGAAVDSALGRSEEALLAAANG